MQIWNSVSEYVNSIVNVVRMLRNKSTIEITLNLTESLNLFENKCKSRLLPNFQEIFLIIQIIWQLIRPYLRFKFIKEVLNGLFYTRKRLIFQSEPLESSKSKFWFFDHQVAQTQNFFCSNYFSNQTKYVHEVSLKLTYNCRS